MTSWRAVILLPFCALVSNGTRAVAQADSARFLRVVEVYDVTTQEGIAGALVRDQVTGNSVMTSATGHFALVPEFVKHSGALIEIRKLGYDPVGPLLIDPMSDTTLLVPMTPAGTHLPAMVTTGTFNLATDAGKWAGFEQRCGVKHVACLRDDLLASHPSATLSDMLLKSGADVKRVCTNSVFNCRVSVGHCAPAYFLDGFPWTRLTKQENPLVEIQKFLGPVEIKGIEVYEPELTPIRFITAENALCPAAVVIWTK